MRPWGDSLKALLSPMPASPALGTGATRGAWALTKAQSDLSFPWSPDDKPPAAKTGTFRGMAPQRVLATDNFRDDNGLNLDSFVTFPATAELSLLGGGDSRDFRSSSLIALGEFLLLLQRKAQNLRHKPNRLDLRRQNKMQTNAHTSQNHRLSRSAHQSIATGSVKSRRSRVSHLIKLHHLQPQCTHPENILQHRRAS